METTPTSQRSQRISRPQATNEMKECMDACTECAQECDSVLSYCLEAGGKHVEAAHMGLLMDCARICDLTASLMARNSTLCPEICELCAKSCDRCAESCEEFKGDGTMEKCAKVCRHCADLCRQMVQ